MPRTKNLPANLPPDIVEAIAANCLGDWEEIRQPNWDGGGTCHNWRNHVSGHATDHWDDLSDLAVAIIYLSADRDAEKEEWD